MTTQDVAGIALCVGLLAGVFVAAAADFFSTRPHAVQCRHCGKLLEPGRVPTKLVTCEACKPKATFDIVKDERSR